MLSIHLPKQVVIIKIPKHSKTRTEEANIIIRLMKQEKELHYIKLPRIVRVEFNRGSLSQSRTPPPLADNMEKLDLVNEYKIFFNSLKGHCDLLSMSESHSLQNLRISWAELPTVDIEPSFVPHSGSVLLVSWNKPSALCQP